MGNDVSRLLTDKNGDRVPFHRFLKDYKKVNGKYNDNWLRAEYNMAQRKASASKQWQDFQKDKSVYPNLKYMPSKSAEPRDAHKGYYGVVKPIDDAFWNDAYPPSGWNCKCWVQQTRDEATTKDIPTVPPPKGIVGNPGKTGRVFNPDHPYIAGTSKTDRAQVKEAFSQLKPAMDKMPVVYHGEKGKVEISLNADPQDYLENFKYSKAVVGKYEGTMIVRPHLEEGKNPELEWEGVVGDRTEWKKAKTIDNYLKNTFKDKIGTTGQLKNYNNIFIAFDFKGKLNTINIKQCVRRVNGELNMPNKNNSLRFLVLKNNDKTLIIKKGNDYNSILNKAKELL